MNPKERRELLDGQKEKTDPLEEPLVAAIEREEQQRRDDKTALEAFRQKPVGIGQVIASNLELCRKVLDPRVILEAMEIGVEKAALEKIKANMERWAQAIQERREGEEGPNRKLRLRKLGDKLFPRTKRSGCGCDGTGMLLTLGTLRGTGELVMRNTSYIRMCDCEKGRAKVRFIREEMGKPKISRGRRRPTRDDAVPI